jgi:MFS family permease
MKIGRRPVYILGTLFNLAGCIWGGEMGTVQQYFGVNILTGVGAAPVDSLVEISTTDIFFLHQRGTRLALYIFAIYAGSYLGPVASGYIAASQGWRWCFWYLVIFFGILLIIQLFSLEESTFRRPGNSHAPVEENINDDSVLNATRDHEAPLDTKIATEDMQASSVSDVPVSSKPKPLVARMNLWDLSQNDPRSFFRILIQPFTLVTYPAVMWAGIVYGVQVMWLSLLATTQSLIFAAPPYNFSIEAVGDTNFSAFIGGCFGMLWGGAMSDWFTQHMARRNKGIMEPEFRLWTMVVPALINMAGLLMYGVGAANGAHWIVSAGFGTAFIAFGIGSGGAIAITYAIDCYPEIASESLVLMLFVRNLLGCGFTFAIQ